jgi:hypothetical protein
MKTNKIIVARNPDGRTNSISIVDYRHSNITTILSTPEPTSESGGWLRQLHGSILDSEFRVSAPITVDLSDIESKFHLQWERGTFDKHDYHNTVLPRLMGEIIARDKLDTEIESITNGSVSPVTEYAQLSHYLDATHRIPPKFKSFRAFAKSINVKGFAYLIQHVDRREKYYAEYAMCIQYLHDKESTVYLTFDPVEFLNMIRDGRFIFCGELFASNCIQTIGEVNNQLAIVVERKISKVMQRITTTDTHHGRSLDAIFL